MSALEAVSAALNQAGVRYLIAGGLAVNAHGYVRLTMDIDLGPVYTNPIVTVAPERVPIEARGTQFGDSK